MSEAPPLKIAVIGAGAMGQGHCKTIAQRVPELRLAAVVDTHTDTAAAVGAQYGVPHFTVIDDLLQARCADAVLVVVPHPLHAAVALPCMRAGLHVLCEKPLADTVGAADAMLVAAQAHGVAFGVMFQRRFDPVLRAAIDFAQAGGIGHLQRALLVVPEFRSQFYFDSNPWRATWRGEGGGVLLNQAAHMLDIFALVAGLPASLRARVETRIHDIEVEDTVEALLRYPDGGGGYLYCSTAEAQGGEALEVVGEGGMLVYRDHRLVCRRFPRGVAAFAREANEVWAQPPAEVATERDGYHPACQDAVLRNFARHILHSEPLLCDAASGLASLELANALTLSGEIGDEVTLPIDRTAYDALLARKRAAAPGHKREVAALRVTDPKFL